MNWLAIYNFIVSQTSLTNVALLPLGKSSSRYNSLMNELGKRPETSSMGTSQKTSNQSQNSTGTMKQYWAGKHNYSVLYGILSKGALKFFLEIHATSFGHNLIHSNLIQWLYLNGRMELQPKCSLFFTSAQTLFITHKNKLKKISVIHPSRAVFIALTLIGPSNCLKQMN